MNGMAVKMLEDTAEVTGNKLEFRSVEELIRDLAFITKNNKTSA